MSELDMIPLAKILNHEIPFGKYSGETISYVLNEDEGYAIWVIGQGESGNPEFNKAAQYFKAAMDCQASGDDMAVLPYSKAQLVNAGAGGVAPKPKAKKIIKTLKKLAEQKVEGLEEIAAGISGEHFEFVWASNVTTDDYDFKISEDNLLVAMSLDEWNNKNKNSFIIIKRTPIGDYLKKIISMKALKKQKGNFYAEVA